MLASSASNMLQRIGLHCPRSLGKGGKQSCNVLLRSGVGKCGGHKS